MLAERSLYERLHIKHPLVNMSNSRQTLLSLLCSVLFLNSTLSFSLKNCSCEGDANRMVVSCERHGLTAVPQDIPRNAVSLSVAVNEIVQINGMDFHGLSRLKSLRCDFNRISGIEVGAFTDLVDLLIIVLNNNRLTHLTDGMFLGLSKLQDLLLSGNNISFISPRAFRSLNSLKSINLASNNLHQVANVILVLSNPNLMTLILLDNKFACFETDDVPEHASNITALLIGSNPLKKFNMTKDVFPHLKELNLDGCTEDMEWAAGNKRFLRSLTDLSVGGRLLSFETHAAMLHSSGPLEQLELNQMNPASVAGLVEIACGISSLRRLDLTNTELGSVDDHLLSSCSQLTELRLPYDHLSRMTDRALQAATGVRILSLNNNHFSKFPVTIRELHQLEILDFSHNLLSELESLDFHHLTKLKHLNLNSNRISSLQDNLFETLLDLENLDLGDNSISSVGNAFTVSLGNLKFLNLHNNQQDVFYPGTFMNLSSLQKLDIETFWVNLVFHGAFVGLDELLTLSLNLVEFTDELFAGLPQLEDLSILIPWKASRKIVMQNNVKPFTELANLERLTIVIQGTHQLSMSPQLFSGLASLESLSVDNFFKGLVHPDTFTFTPKLKYLQILHSDLSHLSPELFWSVPGLKELDLSYNKLQSLDFLAAAKLWALSVLKVTNNGLSVINETVFQSVPALRHLDLSDNPLTCECSNSGFIQWILTDNQTQVVNGYQYTCAFPVPLQGKRFLDFDIHSCWIDEGFLYFISSTCLIVLVLLTSFTSHFLRWHLTYAYYLFLAFLYDYSRRKAGTPHRYDAFISYNVQDEAWVCGELVPVLEGQQGWRLCLHHRDFQPGKAIVENITDAIYSSRKTICVISHHYLQSEWCSREIQMASFRLFDEHRDVLIMLFLEDIPAQQLSPYYRMRRLVKSCSYLSWTQAGPQHARVFWENVRRALRTDQDPVPDHQQLFG